MQLDLTEKQTLLRSKLEENNINPQSFLATDYLNHYNEVLMLIEMIPDMPEIFEEVKEWAPKSYCDHFRDSQFEARDLAIEAYGESPSDFRKRFDDLVAQIDSQLLSTIEALGELVEAGNEPQIRVATRSALDSLHGLTGSLNAVIHGEQTTLPQDAIDELMEDADGGLSQGDIDSLFD